MGDLGTNTSSIPLVVDDTLDHRFRRPVGEPPKHKNDPIRLPPNTSSEKFKDFAQRAAEIVGQENVTVISSPEEFKQDHYLDPSKAHDMFHLLDKDHFLASAVVAPKDVPDVQAIVRLANEFEIPLWPFSIGRNVGYGGAAPRVPGSVGLDMGRNLNKVLKVDPDNAYALVEPGVRYMDLHNYLEERGYREKVWMDVPDLGGGSVIGNSLERGVGYTPYGDHWMMHCGMEIVLPDGTLIRTGMGALPNPNADKSKPPHEQEPNETWQLFNYGFGPYNDGIFTQSSLGIVVKMGIWLMPNPGGYQNFLITFPRDDSLNQIVEIMRPLRIQNILQQPPHLDHLLLNAGLRGNREFFTNSDKPLTDEELDGIAKKTGLGRWNLYGALYGPDPVRDALWRVIKTSFSKVPGAKFYFPEDHPEDITLQTRHGTFQGIPSFTELKWTEWVPNGGHLFFAPIAKISGDDADAQYKLTRKIVEDHGFDFFGAFLLGGREMHHIVSVVFNREDPDARRRAHTVMKLLIKEAADRGWGEYRAHLALMDQISDTYNFNDNAQAKLNAKIKNALDPKGILAPGKNGIWPESYKRKDYTV